MIGYVTLGSNDLEMTRRFYDPLMEMLGATRIFESETFFAWSTGDGTPILAVGKPFDGNAATHGNGTMIALIASSREQVDRLHKKALELGGKNEGEPGIRSGGNYCAYFRDPDGNKLNFHCKP